MTVIVGNDQELIQSNPTFKPKGKEGQNQPPTTPPPSQKTGEGIRT